MSTAKSLIELVPDPRHLAAPRGTVEAAVAKILSGVSRTARVESLQGHARSGDFRAAKSARSGLHWGPAWRERVEA
jgi:hypothetical protein